MCVPKRLLCSHSLAIGFRSVAAVRMLKDGRPIGAVAVMRSQTGLFWSATSINADLRHQAVIAIENTRLFEEVRRATENCRNARASPGGARIPDGNKRGSSAIGRSKFQLQPVLDTLVASAARLAMRRWLPSWHGDAFPGRARYASGCDGGGAE